MPAIFNFTLTPGTAPGTPIGGGAVPTITANDGSIPAVYSGHVTMSGALWAPYLTESGSTVETLLCSASMGWAARDFQERDQVGDFTVMCLDNGVNYPVVAVRSGKDTRIAATLSDKMDVAVGTLNANSVINNDLNSNPYTPGFLFLGYDTGDWIYRFVGARVVADTGSGPGTFSSGTFWDNELGRLEGEIRLVDIPSVGPTIVTYGPSSLDSTKQAFYLKWRAVGSASSDPASEILVDIHPTETLTPDLSSFYAIGLEDGTINIYYRVYDSASGLEGTALFGYNPLRASGALNLDGLVTAPVLVAANLIPVVGNAKGGAGHHRATGEILLALHDTENGTLNQDIRLYATRGLGRTLDTTPLVLDADTHPHYFGGRWENTCPDRTINVNSIGWTSNKAGASFVIVAGFVPGDFSSVNKDFTNTVGTNTTEMRPLIGDFLSKRPEEVTAEGGDLTLASVRSTPYNPSEYAKQGYDFGLDLASAVVTLRFNGVDIDTITSDPDAGTVTADTTNTVPGPGIITTGRTFFQDASQVEIDNSSAVLDTNSLSITCWLYIDAKSGGTTEGIIYKELAATGETYAIEYDYTTNRFLCSVRTTSGVISLTVTSMTAPTGYWYHVTMTYDASTGDLNFYLYGVLVGTASGTAANLNHTAQADVYIGDASGLTGGNASFFGRVDDLTIGSTPMSHAQVIQMFSDSVSDGNGPVFASHKLGVDDSIRETAICVAPEGGDTYSDKTVTVTARTVNFVSGLTLDSWVLYDVWVKEKGLDPVYYGSLPAPPEANDLVNSGTGAYSHNPSLNTRLNPTILVHAPGDTPFLRLFHAIRSDDNDSTTIFRTSFSLGNEVIENISHTVVGHQDTSGSIDLMYGMAVSEFNSNHVVIVGNYNSSTLTSSTLHFIRTADFGATSIGTAPSTALTSVTPATAQTIDGVGNWSTVFSDVGEEPYVCGMVCREMAAGMGLQNGSGDLQVIAGLATDGNTTYDSVLMGTFMFILDGTDLASGTVTLNNSPIQIDNYGKGTTIATGSSIELRSAQHSQPFAPIRLITPPVEASTDDYGDIFILGTEGTRSCEGSRRGGSGLTLYKADRLGSWNLSVVGCIGLDAAPSETYHYHGADAALAATTVEAEAAFTHDTIDGVHLVVSAPHADGTDRACTAYLTAAEDASAGWTTTTTGSVIPVLHPSSEPFACVWQDYDFNSRNYTEVETGSLVLKGSVNQAQFFPHWLYYNQEAFSDTSTFGIADLPVFQGGVYSEKQKLTRFWAGDGTGIRAGVAGKNFLVPSGHDYSGVIGRNQSPYSSDRIEPIGIVDGTFETAADVFTDMGRYYYTVYDGSDTNIIGVDHYRSTHTNELPVVTSTTVWRPTFSFPEDVHKSMRVVAMDGHDVIYFLFGTGTKTAVMFHYVDFSQAGHTTEAPLTVTTLDFGATDRFYAVNVGDGRVALYVGDETGAAASRTTVLVHEPSTNTLVRDPKVLLSGASPFPRSYACAKGRLANNLDQVVGMFEPVSSRDGSGGQGVGGSPTDIISLDPTTGSAWTMATFVTDGYFLLDSLLVTSDDVFSVLGGYYAYLEGGKNMVKMRPTFLSRVTDDEETEDLSTEYTMHVAAYRTMGDTSGDVGSVFFYFDAASTGDSEPRLLPWSVQIEPIGGLVSDGNYYSTIGGVASKLSNWRMTDDDAALALSTSEYVAYDHINGVKAVNVGPNSTILVGWFFQLPHTIP